jgi:hypothetical protein
MTLDQQRKAGFIELAPRVHGFVALWHVGETFTNVAEGANFSEILERAREWARSEGAPLVRGLH